MKASQIRQGFGLALFLLASAPLSSAESIKLANGSTVAGVPTGYCDAAGLLTLRTPEGRNLQLQIEELDQRAVYRTKRDQVARDDALGQLNIAHYARDVGLFAHAVRHYERAAEADPKLGPRVENGLTVLADLATAYYMDQAETALERNDQAEAAKWLTRIVEEFPRAPLAAEAGRRLGSELTRRRDAERQQQGLEAIRKDLRKAEKYLDSLAARSEKALKDARGGSRTARRWEGAIRDGERALAEVDRLGRRYAGTPHAGALATYRNSVVQELVETRLHLASHYSVRHSYVRALDQVNRSLALDPRNEAALDMRARIEEASNPGIIWWWERVP